MVLIFPRTDFYAFTKNMFEMRENLYQIYAQKKLRQNTVLNDFATWFFSTFYFKTVEKLSSKLI